MANKTPKSKRITVMYIDYYLIRSRSLLGKKIFRQRKLKYLTLEQYGIEGYRRCKLKRMSIREEDQQLFNVCIKQMHEDAPQEFKEILDSGLTVERVLQDNLLQIYDYFSTKEENEAYREEILNGLRTKKSGYIISPREFYNRMSAKLG